MRTKRHHNADNRAFPSGVGNCSLTIWGGISAPIGTTVTWRNSERLDTLYSLQEPFEQPRLPPSMSRQDKTEARKPRQLPNTPELSYTKSVKECRTTMIIWCYCRPNNFRAPEIITTRQLNAMPDIAQVAALLAHGWSRG